MILTTSYYLKTIRFTITLAILLLSGCGGAPPEPEIITVSDEEARQFSEQAREQVSVTLAEGMDVSLWASEKLIEDPVALDMDNQGRAWVTVTNRSNSSEFDIRDFYLGSEFDIQRDCPKWEIESLRMEHVEDRRMFLRREFAAEHSEANRNRMPDRNNDGMHDWRDLTVEKEEVYRIEDLTGDGAANQAQLFIRDFHQEITDVAASVLYHNGDVYVGVAPDMWCIRDTNGDGIGDMKESISHGYGVHIAVYGHGVSGLTVGPDGRIYWGIGDPGSNVIDQEGKRWYYPHEGAIFRSEPDGSNFEVFSAGLRNTHEFVFDKYGNLITVDNDGDLGGGEVERLLYVVNGSDTGWRNNWQFGKYRDPKNNDYNVWTEEKYFRPRNDDQSAHILPPLANYHSGPSGMAYNPGTALGEKWQEHFFIASFVGSPVRSAINAFTLKPKGASFELASDQQVLRGIAVSSLDIGPDGALYMADWIEGWSQNGKGRIWKLDIPAEAGSAIRTETRELLAGSFDGYLGDELIELMGHQDMRVRIEAQFELASRGAKELLTGAIEGDDQLRRIHGIWGLGQLGRQDPIAVESLIRFLEDVDPEIRTQVAKILGDIRYRAAAEPLIALLNDNQPRVRFFAAEALGRIGYEPAFRPIVDMLEANDDEDVYLRHGGAIALARIGNGDALADLANHSSRAVRIAAVVALKRLAHPGVARFLGDEDEYIVTNAARAINDDEFIEEALPDLARMLEQERFINEPILRRAINASLYSGTKADASRLAQFAGRGDIPDELRAEALATLSGWADPSVLDRVTGEYRGEVENDAEVARQAIEPVMTGLFRDRSPVVRASAVEMASGLAYRAAIPDLVNLLNQDSSEQVKVAALTVLRDLEYARLEDAFATALQGGEASVREAALEMIPDLDLPAESIVELLETILETGPVDEQQTALESLGQIRHPAAYNLLGEYMDRLMAGNLPPAIELELIEAVSQADTEQLAGRLEKYQDGKPAGDLVAAFRESLYGGNTDRGRRIFYRNAAAQCLRCHVVDGDGSDVGPDLTGVGLRLSREQLLASLVDPSNRLAPGYGNVTVHFEDGESVRGVLEEETETSITISGGAQQSRTIQKSDIAERVNAPSAMPAMGGILSRSELRDLVEYLSSLTDQ